MLDLLADNEHGLRIFGETEGRNGRRGPELFYVRILLVGVREIQDRHTENPVR